MQKASPLLKADNSGGVYVLFSPRIQLIAVWLIFKQHLPRFLCDDCRPPKTVPILFCQRFQKTCKHVQFTEGCVYHHFGARKQGGISTQSARILYVFELREGVNVDFSLSGGESSLVEHTFGGSLRSDVSCLSCGYTSTVHEHFLALSLDVDPAAHLPQPMLKPAQPRQASAVK